MQSQFEDMNMFTIIADNVIELLNEATDNTLREKFIQLAASKTSSLTSIPSDTKVKDEFNYSATYSLSEVHNRLSSKQTMINSDSSCDDLKGEIEHLKKEIKFLKQDHIIYDHRKNNVDESTAEENTLANTFNIDPKQNMSLEMMQIVTDHKWYVKCKILIDNTFSITNIAMIDSGAEAQLAPFDFETHYKKGAVILAEGEDHPSQKTSGSSYRSSSSSPIIQRGGMSLVKLISYSKEATSSIHLDDIPENNPLYAQLRAYLSQKYKEKKNPGRYSSDIYLMDYTSQESHTKPTRYNTSENVYNFSKMIIKQIISVEHWGISSMKERQINLNKITTNFSYWDYINAFSKVCAKIYVDPIPNWFLNWWSYHGPTIKILPDPFLKLYKNWVKNSRFHGSINGPRKDKLMKRDPMNKSLYGQELLDSISQKIQDYGTIPHKGIIVDNSVKYIAGRISIQDGNKEEMIKEYLNEI
ncbi:hypothetical protein H5410_051780 [Solanum commersonii]|uniref:Uncharacterized protein n=1 Tax=Solanum commersonii TaxID=4109 RepID=A0A9J5WZ18_SOLCO|nr:hypothetical protein H5410_051780 [Solanum commersonii]